MWPDASGSGAVGLVGASLRSCELTMTNDTSLPAHARISKIRLFYSGGPQVALYGSPSEVADGWIMNLPAAEVFAGDFSGLVYERLIEANDANISSPLCTSFYERYVRQAPQLRWAQNCLTADSVPNPKLARAVLPHLHSCRVLGSRLAQQARGEKRRKDELRFMAAAADAALKAGELQANTEAASELQKLALRQLNGVCRIAANLARQARLDNRPQDQQPWIAVEADAALNAATHQDDTDAATKLRDRALKRFHDASNLAARLAQQARREGRPQDQHCWLAAAANAAIKAADIQGKEKKFELLQQPLRQLLFANKIAKSLADQSRQNINPSSLHSLLFEATDYLLKAANLDGDAQAAARLRLEALTQLREVRDLAICLAQQAVRDRLHSVEQSYLYSASKAAVLAYGLEPDPSSASQLRATAKKLINQFLRRSKALAHEAKRKGLLEEQMTSSQYTYLAILHQMELE